MKPLPNEVIFVSGQRGSGKSYWVKSMVRSLPHSIIWDPLGEYVTDRIFFDLEEFVDFLILRESDSKLFCISYQSINEQEEFPLFCRAVLATGDVYLICEELDVVTSPYNCPIEFARIIKYGRHYGIQLIGVSRRPAEVSRMFTSQASRFITFEQHEPNDIQYFRSIFGNAALQLSTMKNYQYLDVDFSGTTDFTVKNPI